MATTIETRQSEEAQGGLSLSGRIFLATVVLLALAVGSAAVATYFFGSRVAEEAVSESLAESRAMQAEFLDRLGSDLVLRAELVAQDPAFISYVDAATAGTLGGEDDLEASVDTSSLLDQLLERQEELAEVVVLLDYDGYVLVRTDRPEAGGEDLTAVSLVALVVDELYPAHDMWLDEGRLYLAAVVPVARPQTFDLVGFLMVASPVDDALAQEIRRVSGTDVAFVVPAEGGSQISGSSLDARPEEQLRGALEAAPVLLGRVLDQGEAVAEHDFELDDRRRAYLQPLYDKSGEPVAAVAGLTSLDRALSPFRRILSVLVVAGLGSLLVALLLSFALGRRLSRPVRQLAEAAGAAAQGDYEQPIETGQGGEVGHLARAFDSLLSDLREKRQIESYVSDLSRYLPDPDVGETLSEPETSPAALLAVELGRFATPQMGQDPRRAVERLGSDLRKVARAASAHGGRLVSVSGHRALACFQGADRGARALAAATEAIRRLVAGDDAFDAVQPPAIAVTTGDVVTGSVVWGDTPTSALVGLPVQQAETLLRESMPGDILLSKGAHALLKESLDEAGLELAETRGLLSTQSLFVLSAPVAEQLVKPEARTAAPDEERRAPALVPATVTTAVGPGAVLGGRFEILSVLGTGGMGVVYKARDRELDDLVALKTLRQDLTEADSLERLKSELKLARRITHPNVLRTFDFGELGGVSFISMEYVRGLTLRYLLQQTGKLPFSAGLRLGRQLTAGLGAAHGVGVLHRDIKPENLIIDNAGNAKLMDFGIASPLRRTPSQGRETPGTVLGTPHYLSPEQLQGQEPDARADFYACGVVFYEMFTGALPFTGTKPMEIVVAHIKEEPAPPSSHWDEIPPRLEALILRCLAKEPQERYPDAEALHRDLESLRA